VGLDHRLMGGVDGRGDRLSPRGRELVGQRGADGAKAQAAEVPKTSSSSSLAFSADVAILVGAGSRSPTGRLSDSPAKLCPGRGRGRRASHRPAQRVDSRVSARCGVNQDSCTRQARHPNSPGRLEPSRCIFPCSADETTSRDRQLPRPIGVRPSPYTSQQPASAFALPVPATSPCHLS